MLATQKHTCPVAEDTARTNTLHTSVQGPQRCETLQGGTQALAARRVHSHPDFKGESSFTQGYFFAILQQVPAA